MKGVALPPVLSFLGHYRVMFILQENGSDPKPAEGGGNLLMDFRGIWVRLFMDYPMDYLQWLYL